MAKKKSIRVRQEIYAAPNAVPAGYEITSVFRFSDVSRDGTVTKYACRYVGASAEVVPLSFSRKP